MIEYNNKIEKGMYQLNLSQYKACVLHLFNNQFIQQKYRTLN